MIKHKKLGKGLFAGFITTLITTLGGGITAYAANTASNYEVSSRAVVATGYKSFFRSVGYSILLFLADLVDKFDAAIDKLIGINLYNAIGEIGNVKSNMYAIGGAVAGAAIIIAAILLLLNFDKGRVSDSLRNILIGLMLIIAFPSMISACTDLKRHGTRFAKNAFDGSNGVIVNDDTTVIEETLGNKILISQIYDIGESINNNALTTVSKRTRAKSIDINTTLSTTDYNMKPFKRSQMVQTFASQTNYKELSEDEKIKLIDRMTLDTIHNPNTLYSLKIKWDNRSDDDIIRYSSYSGMANIWFCKKGGIFGGTYSYHQADDTEKVYANVKKSGNTWVPIKQVFKDKCTGPLVVYRDDPGGPRTDESDKERKERLQQEIRWGQNWFEGADLGWNETEQYMMSYDCYNYQHELCDKLASQLCTAKSLSNLPENAAQMLNKYWIDTNIKEADTLGEAIIALESLKIKSDDTELSVLEWFNVQENYDLLGKIDESKKYKNETWVPLEKTDRELNWNDLLLKKISVGGDDYLDERLYKYNFDFLEALTILVVTAICLIFAGFRLAALMFDVIFAELISPIVVATDMTGSGRAKQMFMNLLSCNICFIVVMFLVRLYITVITWVYTQDFGLIVNVFLTLAGAKFVIDGPDLIVKLIGVDAGVKSGLATVMGARTAAQMAGGAVRTATGAAKSVSAMGSKIADSAKGKANTAARTVGGAIGGAISGGAAGAALGAVQGHATGKQQEKANKGHNSFNPIQSAAQQAGTANAAGSNMSSGGSALGNSSAGQAFKQAANSHNANNSAFEANSAKQNNNSQSGTGGNVSTAQTSANSSATAQSSGSAAKSHSVSGNNNSSGGVTNSNSGSSAETASGNSSSAPPVSEPGQNHSVSDDNSSVVSNNTDSAPAPASYTTSGNTASVNTASSASQGDKSAVSGGTNVTRPTSQATTTTLTKPKGFDQNIRNPKSKDLGKKGK